MATHLLNEAHALAYAGFYRDARALIEAALESAQQRDALAAQVWFEVVLGEIERDRGFGRASVDHFEAATALADAAGQQAALVWAWVGVAQGQLIPGNIDAGADALSRRCRRQSHRDVWSTRERTRLALGRGPPAGACWPTWLMLRTRVWPFEASLRHDLVRFGDPDSPSTVRGAGARRGRSFDPSVRRSRAAVARPRATSAFIEQFVAMD
jgi:hypothetical protein